MPTSVRRLPRWRPLASGSCAPLLANGISLRRTTKPRTRTAGKIRMPALVERALHRYSWLSDGASGSVGPERMQKSVRTLRSRIAAGLQLAWRAAVARGARALRRQYPTPGWALARSTWVLPRTNANACSHTLTHPSARAQVPAQTTRSIGTVDLVQGAAVEAHSPSPSPALRRALP